MYRSQPAAVPCQKENQKELKMVRGDILYEKDKKFSKDIDSYQIGGAAVVPAEKTFVDRSDHGCDVEEKEDEAAFEQTLEEPDLDAEAIVEIAAEVMVGGLDKKKIGAEIVALEAAAQDQIAGIHVAEHLVEQKGAGVFVVEVPDMNDVFEHFEPVSEVGKELIDEIGRHHDDEQF